MSMMTGHDASTPASLDKGIYKGTTVALKKVRKKSVTFERADLLELNMVSRINFLTYLWVQNWNLLQFFLVSFLSLCSTQITILPMTRRRNPRCIITYTLRTLRPRQDGRHFPDDIFKRIFLNENVWILTKISLKFVPRGPIYNIPALVLTMAWRRPGDKPLSEPMTVLFIDTYMRHSASIS